MHHYDSRFRVAQIFIYFIFLDLSIGVLPSINASQLIATFTAAGPIQNLVVLPDKFILGATNNIYVVDAQNLSRLQHASTGPVVDSPYCNAELTSCVGTGRSTLIETDNVNKILHFIRPLSSGSGYGTLLTCGSTRQGVCELRDAEDIHRFTRRSVAIRQTAVAANTASGTTVSYLDPEEYDRLYVAATYTHDSPYRDGFPAVATRLLSANFAPINSGAIDGEAAVVVRAEYRAAYRIRYIGTFADDKYVYFGSVQPRTVQSQMGGAAAAASSLTNPLVSRLIRVCRNDDKYTSYSEIELQCRSADGNTKYNILTAMVLLHDSLFGAFTDSEGRNKSAICIFQMPKIRLTFFYNIDRCRSGTDSVGLPHIGRDAKCFNRSSLPLAEDTCQLGVGGAIEASQLAAMQLPYVITSIDAAIVEDHVLVFAGTSTGDIIKMEMSGEHNKRLDKYAQFTVGPDPVGRLRFLDDRRSFVVVAGRELMLLLIASCGNATTSKSLLATSSSPSLEVCEQCATGNRDPLCGWCLIDGRCSRQADCSALLLKRCPHASATSVPRNVSAEAFGDGQTEIFVPFLDWPRMTNEKINFECHFGVFKSTARLLRDGLSCPLPSRILRISLSSTADDDRTLYAGETEIDFSVRVNSPTRVQLFGQRLVVYNCATYSVCSICTTSKWSCRWCASESKCQTADGRCAETFGTKKCAKINMEQQTEILIPDSTNASVSFSVVDMEEDDRTGGTSLTCVIQPTPITGQRAHPRRVRLPATLKNGRIRCADLLFSYADDEPERKYALELFTGQQIVDKTSVTLYKCHAMADDCSQCLSLDPKWGCAWCEGECVHSHLCANTTSSDGSITTADQLCVQPVISYFRPNSAPLDGGTLIEIVGRDLGSRMSDVQNRVHVAGSLCRVIAYEVSRRISCILEKGTGSGPVRVAIGQAARRVVESSMLFYFRNPVATSIYPAFGPMSGGTRLTIYGENLRIGSNISVYLDNLPCQVINTSKSDDEIQCLTSSSRQEYTVTAIRVQIDSTVRMLHVKYTYRPDPIVSSIYPSTSFESGGRMISVIGVNLDAVLSARMFLLSSADEPAEIISDASVCQILNSTLMKCASPRLTLPPALRQSTYGRWPVGIEMDGVTSTCNLALNAVFLSTVADPQFAAFKGLKVQPYDQPLIIEGDRLAQSVTLDEYLVTIGTEPCVAYLLDDRQLLCRLPADVEPAATDDTGTPIEGGHPLVVVRVGALRVELGPIEIDNSDSGVLLSARRLFYRLGAWRVMALALVAGASLILIALVLLFLRRRQINEHERAYERIRLQIEHMESSVRHECKQAFAELQTDMLSDLSSTLNDADIPYRPSAQFVTRLLFRDFNEQRGYAGADCMALYSSNLPFALEQFAALLWQRQFVFSLVEWADNDPTITISERTTLAALLTSVLIRNFTHFTDIVLALLSAHIHRTVMNDRAALLFRQSDSVVEKLFQHWMTISMLPYVARNTVSAPGRHLYLLYKALKLQVEKGPVDTVTGKSRYSLSEQCLLRESVDASTITLMVIPLEGFDQAPIALRVLDCDTISQTKQKLLDQLYRNRPFSSRITIAHFDLEWNSSRYGTVILQDDDAIERRGEKRINTIGYYKLQDNCMLTMQPSNSANQSLTFQSDTATTCSARSARHLLNTSSSTSPDAVAGGATGISPAATIPSQFTGATFLADLFVGDHTRYYHLAPPSVRGDATTRRVFSRPISALDFETRKKKKKKRRDPPSDKHFRDDNNYHCFGNNNNNSLRSDSFEGMTLSPHNGGASSIPEVFLTRMLMCKTAVLPYVQNFFDTILFVNNKINCEMPVVMRFVLQFLDEEAARHNMIDSDVLDAWKVNALVLRFWMQLLHNPDFLFDVQRHNTVDASLIVIGQTLVDAFSSGEMTLGCESPSSKLLFAKEITKYRPLAREIFRRTSANASSQKMTLGEFQDFIVSMHQPFCNEIDAGSAVGELLAWVKSRGVGLATFLERDACCVKYGLFQRFRQMIDYGATVTGDSDNFYASIK